MHQVLVLLVNSLTKFMADEYDALHVLENFGQTPEFPCWSSISQFNNTLGELPAVWLAGDGILHRGRDTCADAQPAEAVLTHSLGIAEATETLLASEAAVTRAADTTKGQLNSVVDGKIVNGDHSSAQTLDDGLQVGVTLGAVDRGSEAEVVDVGNGENVLRRRGLCAEEGQDRGEALILGDAHVGRHVCEESRLEVVALGVVRMVVTLAPSKKTGSLGDGLVDEFLEAIEGGVRDHGTNISLRTQAESLDTRRKQLDELIVDGAGGNDTLDTDTVLASSLEGSAKDDFRDALEITGSRVENDKGVLAAELGNNRSETLGSTGSNMVGDALGADKGDVAHTRVGGEMAGGLGPAHDSLDKLGVKAMGGEGAAGDTGKVGTRPSRLLRDLDDDAVARKERTNNGTNEVVEGIVPADKGSNDTQGLIVHRVALIHHEEVGRTSRGTQGLLAVDERPLDLLNRDEDLAKLSIDHGLAAVQASNLDDLLRIVEDVLHHRAQHGAALVKRGLGPCLLSGSRSRNGAVDGGRRRGVYVAEELPCGRGVALNGGAAGDLYGGDVDVGARLGDLGRRDRVAAGAARGGRHGGIGYGVGDTDEEDGGEDGSDGGDGREGVLSVRCVQRG